MRYEIPAQNGAGIMVFTIISIGTDPTGLNIVPFIGQNGIKWTNNGIDSADAGRVQNGLMFRGLITTKAKCEISCLWMNKGDVCSLLQAIMPEYVTVVTDTIPWINGQAVLTMYSNNFGASIVTEYSDGERVYGDVEFPLVER